MSLSVHAAAATVGTAQVRQVPAINGGATVEGSIHMMTGGAINLNGGATITGDLLVPGTPVVRINGKPAYGGTQDGAGATTPSNYLITLNGNATLRHVIRRTAPLVLAPVSAPPAPGGTRSVNLDNAGQPVGDWATLRNLTLNGNVGQIAVPPGTYGDFTANGGGGFTVGTAGATQPSVYNFQRFNLNGQARIQVLGPVVINLANGFSANGQVGTTTRPDWLTLNVATGSLNLNGGASFYAYLNAPSSSVIINGNSRLVGGLIANSLIVNGGGLLRLEQGGGGGPVNTAPSANSQSLSTPEDTALALTLSATDPENDPLGYRLVSLPATGTLTLADGSPLPVLGSALPSTALRYTPAANATDEVSFTFRARDSAGLDSNLATVSIAVTPVNDVPVVAPVSATTPEDVPVTITLLGGDIDSTTLTYAAQITPITGDDQGTVVVTGATATYTPPANQSGTFTFTYTATDDAGAISASAIATVTVTPVNDAPVVAPVSATTPEDIAVTIALLGGDIDSTTLTYAAQITPITGDDQGTVVVTGATATYTPPVNQSGTFTFTYVVTDSGTPDSPGTSLTSTAATVTVTVTPVNDAPTAVPTAAITSEDTAVVIALLGSDIESDTLAWAVVQAPVLGSVTINGNQATYTPTRDANGVDHFTVHATDGAAFSNEAQVDVTIIPVDDLPTAAAQAVTLAEDTPTAITLAGTSTIGSSLIYRVVSQPAHGTLGGSVNQLVYTPALNFNGPDRFTFTVEDSVGESEPAVVSLVVTPRNDAPAAFPFTAYTSRGQAIPVLLAGADPEQIEVAVNAPTTTAHGTLTLTDGSWVYQPAADFTGTDSFGFTVTDGELESASATVHVIVSPDNAPPTVSAGTDRVVALVDGMLKLEGFVADDGLPVAARLATAWRLTAGSDTARLTAAEHADATLHFTTPGAYVLRLTADDGLLTAWDEVSIMVVANGRPSITSEPPTHFSVSLSEGSSSEVMMTVRDFQDSHIDFEESSYRSDSGAVLPLLDAARKPVFAGPDGRASITNAASFNQWYRDVPGVNLTTTVRLPLTPKPGSPGVLQYVSDNFFPIDGQLFGNQTYSQNYHFTAEWHGEFTYRGAEVLKFRGDDDVWVFINNRLVIDLGGVHGPADAEIALDTLGLRQGRAYPIDLFFAERHTTSSSFRLETTLTLNGSGVYQYEVEAEDPDGDELTYRLVQAPPGMSIDATTGLISWPVGKGEIGRVEVVVEVTDTAGLSTRQPYSLDIVGNERPIVSTPAFISAIPGEPTLLTAFAVDDGQPEDGGLVTTWSAVLDEDDVDIANPASPATEVTFARPGVYRLEFLATDSVNLAGSVTDVRAAVSCDPLPAGAVAWWPFNGDLVDSISRVALQGRETFGQGHAGLALKPAGSYDDLSAINRSDLDLAVGDGFTVELWFDPLLREFGEGGEPGEVWYQGQSGGVFGWGDSARNGVFAKVEHLGGLDYRIALVLQFVDGNYDGFDVDVTLQQGFNHLGVAYDALHDRVAVYVNGVLGGERTALPARLRTEGVFGLNWPHSYGGFGGLLDEVTLYNRALAGSEIASLCALGRAGKCPQGINRAPVVRTGTYRGAVLGAVENLPATISDDGLPLGGDPVLSWTVVSEPAPGSVLFDDVASPSPRVVFRAVGTYQLLLTADDGELTAYDTLTVLVRAAPNQAPQVNVGDDIALSLDTPLNLRPAVSDDASPAGRVLSHVWSLVSGPVPVIWGNVAARDTTVAFREAGVYVLRLDVSDGELTGADQLQVTVAAAANTAPTVNLGADRSFAAGTSIALPAPAITDDGHPSGALSYQWTRISGPVVSFVDATLASPGITFSGPGVYVLRLTVSDGALSGYDEIQITLQPGPNQPPSVNIGQDITLPLNGRLRVEASVADDGQPLGRTLAYDWSQVAFTPAASGAAAGLAAIDPDPLDPANPLKRLLTFDQPGVYQIRLAVTEWLDGVVVRVGTEDSVGTDDLVVTVDVPVNAAPYVNVGHDITIPLGATLRVPAIVSNDDGLPTGAVLTAAWSKRSGPGSVTFPVPPDARDQFDTGITFGATGTYVVRLTATDGDLSAFDELTVIVGPAGNAAPQVSLGADLELSRDTVLYARPVVQDDGLPAGGALLFAWSQVGAPAGGVVTFGDASSRDTTLTFSSVGTYVVRLVASDGSLSGQDELTLHVTSPLNRAPVVAAGSDVSLLENQTLILNGAAADDELPLTPGQLAYLWEVVPATDAAYVGFVDASGLPATPDSLVQRVRFSRPGTYTLRLTANDGELASEPDDLVVTVGPRVNQAPRISAPATVSVAPSVARIFPFAVSDDGLPAGAPLSHRWLQTDASGSAVVFGNPDAADCTLLFPAPGAYTVALVVTEGPYGAGGLSATHAYAVTVESAANQTPLVAAALASDFALAGQPAALTAAALDDGLPAGSALAFAWTRVSGPAEVAFANATALDTAVTFPVAGDYVLRFSASDSELTAATDVTVSVAPPGNQAPAVSLPAPFSAALGSASTLRTAITDDGLPAGSALSYVWSFTSDRTDNVHGLVLATPSAAETVVTFAQPGTYTLRLTVSDGALSTVATTTVAVAGTRNQPPAIVATFPPARVLAGSAELYADAVASDPDGDAVSVDFVAVGPAPATTGRRVTDTAAPFQADFGDLAPGAYAFHAVARDARGAALETPRSNVLVLPAGTTVGGSLSIVAPVADDTIIAPVAVTGFAQDPDFASYRLQYRAAAEAAAPWTDFAGGTTPVGSGSGSGAGTLGTFDPGLLRNGLYDLRIVLATTSGAALVSDPVRVNVDGRRKVGVFSVSFRDLSLPLAGLPIEITRTYDSRDRAAPGDFGHGWSLGVNSVKVRKNRALGRDWYLDVESFDAYGSTYYIHTLDPDTAPSGARPVKHLVTLAFPDDTLQTFEAYLDVQTGTAGAGGADLASMLFGLDLGSNQSFTFPITEARIRFRPANARTRGALELVDTAPAWLVEGAASGPVQLLSDYDIDAPVFDATRFRYTSEDGVVYLLNERDGLESITDLQDNRLELVRDSATGRVSRITHGSGQTVVINRDAMGRVESLRDPYGAYIDYAYDNAGDLIGVMDRAEAFTAYEYYTGSTDPREAHLAHYLKNIVDPRGTLALRNEYDDEGRLVSQLDAAGNPVEFVRDEANVEKIVDRLRHVTRHEYDNEGNVTRTVQADGSVLRYAYEDPANPTSVTARTDALGQVTRYTYDAAGRVLTQTDPLGRSIGMTYDARGNPLTVTDARGHGTTSLYHPADAPRGFRGQPATLTDAAGHVTTFVAFDSRGNLLKLRDAAGVETHSTYDAQDRLRTQTTGYVSAAVPGDTTTYDYDDFGRVESETRTVTQSDLSKQTLVTAYEYDAEGRLTRTYLPGHTPAAPRFTATDYDENGNPVTLTDELGRITDQDYDERGNLVRTTYPEVTIGADDSGSPLKATYTEEFAYDAENRRILAKDRADRWTRTCYDALGRVIASYQLGEDIVTRDEALTALPGTGTLLSATRYDLAGRVTDNYDALGNRTAYAYDAAGRRTRVTPPGSLPARFTVNADGDALVFTREGDLDAGRATVTTYDEVGNVATFTDARGFTTRHLYDKLNRRTETILPDQRRVREVYDALGRREQSIDAEGRITRYGYDVLGRLTSVTDARLQTTSYGYDEAGRQTTQTDALGRVTRYAYDEQGRRVSRTLPDGKTERYFYDEAGRLESRVDFNGEATAYLYDEHDRLVSRTPSTAARLRGALQASFAYTATGRRLSQRLYDAADQFAWWENYEYDERDRLETKQTPVGTLGYTHDEQGNLASITVVRGTGQTEYRSTDLTYYYDADNRLEDVEDRALLPVGATPRTTSYDYNAAGALETVTLPNGLTSTYSYDGRNQLTDLVAVVNGSTQASFHYTHRATGHRASLEERIGAAQVSGTARRTTWTYDEIYRLTGETIAAGTGDLATTLGTVGYSYDAVGNRLKRTTTGPGLQLRLPTSASSYNIRDQLTTDSYDANGNTLVGQIGGLASAASDTYDGENRLTQRTESGAGGRTIRILYDADGNRVRKTVFPAPGSLHPVQATYYLVDTLNPTGYAQVIEEHTQTGAGATTLTKSYAYGMDLISVSDVEAETVRYYGYDGLGSVRYLTSENGTITDRYYYDAYGVLLSDLATGDPAIAGYLYAGEQWDADLGLYYNRARYLNPDTGRFWSQDSYEGVNTQPQSLHKYLYAHADPVNGIDPSGNFTLTETQAISFITTSWMREQLSYANAALSFARNKFGADPEIDQIINSLRNAETALNIVDITNLGVGLIRGGYKLTQFIVSGRAVGFLRSMTNGAHSFIRGADDIPRDLTSPWLMRIDLRNPGMPHSNWAIDTSTFMTGTKLSAGGVRNSRLFWKGWAAKRPDTLSRTNFERALRGDSPVIDEKWIKYFPEHSNYRGEQMIHHHEPVGGIYAIPVPESTHVGSGGPWHGHLLEGMN